MKVFLLDHSTIVRRWAISLMSGLPGFGIIGGAQDPRKAIRQLMRQKPDVLIMDERMQRELGIDILQSIRDLTPPPMVIMLTNKVFNRLQQKVTDVKADFPLDECSEWNKIPEILHFIRKRKETDPAKLFT